jgi:hypothetical protein
MSNRNRYWRLWAKSLGEKVGTTDREADQVALIRSIVVLVNFMTCFFIIAGVIHQW